MEFGARVRLHGLSSQGGTLEQDRFGLNHVTQGTYRAEA